MQRPTVHKPSTIRGNVCFGNDKVEISEDLYNFQQYSMSVCTIDLNHEQIGAKQLEKRQLY